MPRALVYHSIEVFADGSKTLKLRKLVVEDGDILLEEPYIHQIEGDETAAQAAARLRDALGEKWPALSTEDKQRIAAIMAAA